MVERKLIKKSSAKSSVAVVGTSPDGEQPQPDKPKVRKIPQKPSSTVSGAAAALLARRRFEAEVKKIKDVTDRPVLAANEGAAIVGLKIPFPLQYLFDSSVLPLGIVMEVAGTQESCKSMFSYELGRIFIDSAGWMEDIVTEGKFSPDLAYSIIGWSKERRDCFNKTQANSMNMWQSALQSQMDHTIEMIRKGDKANGLPPGAFYPVLYAVDSIVGANMEETNEKIDTNGFAGRQYSAEALSLTTYLKKIANTVVDYPFVALFVNHLKIDPAPSAYEQPTKRRSGSKQLQFQDTYRIDLSGTKKEAKAINTPNGKRIREGRKIKFEVSKNSLGDSGRSMEVWVTWETRAVSETRSLQFTKWNWNDATTQLLIDFQEGKLHRRLNVSSSTRKELLDEYFHIRKEGPGQYISKTLDITTPISADKMGQLINSNPEALTKLRHAFGIHTYEEWAPGVDYLKQRAAAIEALAKRNQDEADAIREAEASMLSHDDDLDSEDDTDE
jgi:hypothetical protein